MKQETTVESFINDNYNSYKNDRIKYYHTDTVKEPMDSYKPIRYYQYSLLISRIVTVRALNAYQCPDSCMFLFEMFEGNDDDFGSFFSMLYTGDFCYNNKMKDYCKSIISIIPSLTLLHVDDTACLLNKDSLTGIPYSRNDAEGHGCKLQKWHLFFNYILYSYISHNGHWSSLSYSHTPLNS